MSTTKRQRANIERYKGRVKMPSEKAIRESGMPKTSWWLGASRARFQKKVKEEEPRMRRSSFGRSPFERLAG